MTKRELWLLLLCLLMFAGIMACYWRGIAIERAIERDQAQAACDLWGR